MQVFNASMSIHSINFNAIFSDEFGRDERKLHRNFPGLRLVIIRGDGIFKIDIRNIRRTFNCFYEAFWSNCWGKKPATCRCMRNIGYIALPVNLTMRSLVSFFQYMIVPFLIAFGDEDGTAPYSLFSRRR